jgi:hypothetical protein
VGCAGESPDSNRATPDLGVWRGLTPEKCPSKHLKSLKLHKKLEKRSFVRKNLLRTQAPNRKHPFTGGAEANDGAPDGPDGNETQNKIRGRHGEARQKRQGASQSILSLRSLKTETN